MLRLKCSSSLGATPLFFLESSKRTERKRYANLLRFPKISGVSRQLGGGCSRGGLQTPSSPKHPGTDAGEDPHHQSRANVRLRMLIKSSFHQRNRNTTRLCAPCSAPSATKPARRSVLRADVATVWTEGNRSLTPVRVPSHRYVHHPPPWRRVAHLPSDSLKSHCFFTMINPYP